MPLFSLEPLNAEALEVCRRCDPGFHDILEGKGVLSFGHRASRTAGQIVTFGRDPDNDVVLPCAGPGPRGNPNNYRAIIHFFFYYAPSGEVILRDMTPRLTEVEVHDVSPDDQLKYALQGSPRIRVIPRSNLKDNDHFWEMYSIQVHLETRGSTRGSGCFGSASEGTSRRSGHLLYFGRPR